LPEGVGFIDALRTGGKMGRLNVITSGVEKGHFNWNDRYNIWSGLIGGFFLALSYFGTDQSQVGRYLTAKSLTESRLGLLMNGLVKVPMQFFILLIGVLVFTFYQFNQAPLFFNEVQVNKVAASPYKDSLRLMQLHYAMLSKEKTLTVSKWVTDSKTSAGAATQEEKLRLLNQQTDKIRADFKTMIGKAGIGGDANDTNYIFLRFVIDYLPKGLVGLLIAVIFLAAWGSIAAALNSLASCTVIDIHKKFIKKDCTDIIDYKTSRWYTFAWGVFSIIIAMFATNMGSLIEAVNVLGSLFYGVILGVFLVAFYLKRVQGNAVFISAVLVELCIVLLFWKSAIGFLWLNAIGAIGVVLLALVLQPFFNKKTT